MGEAIILSRTLISTTAENLSCCTCPVAAFWKPLVVRGYVKVAWILVQRSVAGPG
jgi:hypothetical protein